MGYLKVLVYRDPAITESNLLAPANTGSDLLAPVHAACTFVDTMLRQSLKLVIPRRTHTCLDMRGSHFDHPLT